MTKQIKTFADEWGTVFALAGGICGIVWPIIIAAIMFYGDGRYLTRKDAEEIKQQWMAKERDIWKTRDVDLGRLVAQDIESVKRWEESTRDRSEIHSQIAGIAANVNILLSYNMATINGKNH